MKRSVLRPTLGVACLLLASCVATKTRTGYSFGIDADHLLGSRLAEFQTAKGRTLLRRNVDGSYALRFAQRLQVYRIGQYDAATLVAVAGDDTLTGVLLQLRQGNCTTYELLNVRRGEVEKQVIRPGCAMPVTWRSEQGRLAIRQDVPQQAEYWIWQSGELRHGREPPSRAVAAPRSGRPTPVRATPTRRSTVRAGTAAAQSRAAPRTTSHATSASKPSRPDSGLVIPAGNVQTERITPTKVVLQDGN